MQLVDVGSGPPIVVIPGIQGRWEWMKPGVEALASRCRVITFSLADEPSCGGTFDADSGFDCYVEQVREALDSAGVEEAAICGISYGGLVAAAFALRYPERVRSMILVSALPPSWTPDRRVRFYMRAPRLLTPMFMVTSLMMYREIAAAYPGLWASVRAAVRHGWNVLTHMFSPTRMARRVRLLERANLGGVAQLDVPVLVVTGEADLDRVVPVSATREYLRLFPHARMATIERSGHLGFITKSQRFVSIVAPFVNDTAAAAESRRRLG